MTRCIVEEIRKLGPDFGGALVIARRFESRRCGHDTPIPAADCLRSMVGETNPHSYLVATQDTKLRNDLRRIPAVPLCYIQYNTVILEEPSAASTQRAKELEAAKAMPKPSEIAAAKKVKEEGKPAFVLHRKQPAKGPNPLSVKKSTAAKAAPKTPEKKAVKSAEEKPQTSDNAEAESSEAATKKRVRIMWVQYCVKHGVCRQRQRPSRRASLMPRKRSAAAVAAARAQPTAPVATPRAPLTTTTSRNIWFVSYQNAFCWAILSVIKCTCLIFTHT